MSRKLPTMMPMLAVIATAVANAAVKIEVRAIDPRSERVASSASMPKTLAIQRWARATKAIQIFGTASEVPATNKITDM